MLREKVMDISPHRLVHKVMLEAVKIGLFSENEDDKTYIKHLKSMEKLVSLILSDLEQDKAIWYSLLDDRDKIPKTGRLLLFIPDEDESRQYRVVDARDVWFDSNATHFIILDQPEL